MVKINKNVLTHVKYYIMITLGLVCYCFGYSAFVFPDNVVTVGFTVLASLRT